MFKRERRGREKERERECHIDANKKVLRMSKHVLLLGDNIKRFP